MAGILATSRLGAKGRTVVPKAVRETLDVGPGDQIGYAIGNGRVVLIAMKTPQAQEDPFPDFEEWASEVDIKGYAMI